ncbi:unnamed protein product [Acanthoscelides obtectus]|uniref:Delta-like protein n=1 Tax=Acanthoscelides obtectus TaxID=200917 RepID=A0A9P0LQP5_ACAOB|nr:unnamed protein product [Acanthoscelides obtectus]CAK1627550.1 Neurogenic locus protein delta [Acanthoscelides obtectus]
MYSRIFLSFLWLIFAFHQANSSGVFELRLISFDNEGGKTDLGKCCSGPMSADSECEGICRPRFRVCLKEYQVKIDTTSPCTFGDVITSVLGPNPATDTPQNGFDNSIAFPFPFTWPRTFSLIVEAWHGNRSSHSAVLVSRLMTQRYLDVGENWTKDSHSSKYSTLRFEYRVTCDSNYYGQGCENLCRPRDDSFGHYSCSPSGERVCLAGWTGDYCSKQNCIRDLNKDMESIVIFFCCRCQSGWEGPLCNQCQRYPGCMHGTCVEPWGCLCKEGWGGLFCNQDLNFCTNHKPCRNGGTCFNTGQGSYTCSCAPGFNGTDCEAPTDNCLTTPCLNGGTCSSDGPYNVCVCPFGFSGARCEVAYKTCANSPCNNGATCTNTEAGYRCTCKPGYTGVDCETQLSACLPSPCKNNASCVESSTNGGFRCICPIGFSGSRCEKNIDDCQGNPCLNGGTCVDRVNEFRCHCVPGYVGPLCQNRVDYCITKPCANGGTCTQLINDYSCKCAPGFVGKDCSVEVNECVVNPCRHGGTCVNRIHGYECLCPAGFSGHECEEMSSSAAPSARVSSSESSFTAEHVVVIATISTFVPLVVLVAVGVIVCLKQRRKREKARADEEARLQNEQNTANSSFVKRGAVMSTDPHMIKNSWGKCTNNVLGSTLATPDDCSVSNISICDGGGLSEDHLVRPGPHQVIDGRAVYTLQRSRSQKQLNTEATSRASALLTAKLHEADYETVKRLSVMSSASSAMCGPSILVVAAMPRY